jgi:ArsR family transcriptional regulator, nickel/cobalt-responsive transcriptional repressor
VLAPGGGTTLIGMGHGVEGHSAAAGLDPGAVKTVAATLQALATPSRLLILARLRESPTSVGELAQAVAMEPSAVSHQLRLLRALGLVTGERRGRTIVYSLYDTHVAQLLDEAVYHVEHLRLGRPDRAAPAETA